MQGFHSSDDRARSWRRFCRTGWRMAWGSTLLGLGVLTVFSRITPQPPPLPHEAPVPLSWRPATRESVTGESSALDIQALWTPSAFALSSPAGFSHSQRHERVQLTPPLQGPRSVPALPATRRPASGVDLLQPGRIRLAAPQPPSFLMVSDPVFPPRAHSPETPSLSFPEGWESRLFSGIDLNYPDWSEVAWNAQVEIHFDANGLPVSVLLSRSSGLPEVDRRLARSVSGWRLLEASAPRWGQVAWSCPRPVPPGAPVSNGEGETP